MAKGRAVQVPGDNAASPEAAVAAVTGDDLAQFDSDTLPAAPAQATVTLTQAQLDAQIQAAVARAVRRAMPAKSSDSASAIEVVSVAEARAMQAAAVKEGKRPRAILTPEGWLVHPEMARVAEHGKE